MSAARKQDLPADFDFSGVVKVEDYDMLSDRVDTLESNFSVEGFTKIFCEKVDLSTKMRDSISSVISCLITKDEAVRQAIKKLISESDKRTFLVVLGKAGFVLYQIFLVVLGAAIANWFKSPK